MNAFDSVDRFVLANVIRDRLHVVRSNSRAFILPETTRVKYPYYTLKLKPKSIRIE